MVTLNDIRQAARELYLCNRPLCVHASFRSFGGVEGGPATVIDGLLAEGCTVIVPAWTLTFAESPDWVWHPDNKDIDPGMGAIAAAVVQDPRSGRGHHPLCSFAAIGIDYGNYVGGYQLAFDPLNPLRRLICHQGFVILMGVGLNRMTLLHRAEQEAGRPLFRRKVKTTGLHGPREIEAKIPGCSLGFVKLEDTLAHLCREKKVGKSLWRVFPAKETLEVAVRAIQLNPAATHCNRFCSRCNAYLYLGGASET